MANSCSFWAGIKEFTPTLVNDAESADFDIQQLSLNWFL
jgi:hypothetical protein